jgi:UMF1 family MFS transporter
VLLAAQLAVITFPTRFGLPDAATASRWAFASVAIWWAAFTVPLLRQVHEPRAATRRLSAREAVRDSFARLRRTFHELRRHREALKFLVAFWLYNDGIGTIVKMATIFGAEVGIGQSTLIGALLMVQILGFPFALLFARLARGIGPQRAIQLGLLGYLVICVMGYFLRTGTHFWILAGGVSVVQGGTQALSRSLFAGMIPSTDRSGEFFGFYNVSSKFAGILGPLIFASVGAALGSSRYGVVALVVLFAAGSLVLSRVRPERSEGPLAVQSS